MEFWVGVIASWLGGCLDYSEETCFDLGGTPELTLEVVAALGPADAGTPDAGDSGVREPSCEHEDVRVGDTFTLEVKKERHTGCARLSCSDPYLNQGSRPSPDSDRYYWRTSAGDATQNLQRLECEPPARVATFTSQCEAVRAVLISLRSPPRGVDFGAIEVGNEDFSLARVFSTQADRELACLHPEDAFPPTAYWGGGSSFWCIDRYRLRVSAVKR